MLEYNKKFVEGKEYEQYGSDSVPNKKMVLFTCMESRLVELLPRALNIHNGVVKMVKNAGAIIRKPFDSIIKSLFLSVNNLKAEHIIVIVYHDCGISNDDTDNLVKNMKEKGISEETLNAIDYAVIDVHQKFHGFETVEDSIKQSVDIIRNHPLLPDYVKVHGLVIDPNTGKFDVVYRDPKSTIDEF